MKNSSLPKPDINQRFEYYIVDNAIVQQLMGISKPDQITYKQAEQSQKRRALLPVEKQTLKTKIKTAQDKASYVDKVSRQVFTLVHKKLRQNLQDPLFLFENLLGLDDSTINLLEHLASPSCSIRKIEPMAAAIPWLYDELIKLVNTAKFRRVDSRGKVIPVDTLRSALSYVGVENLKIMLPSLILKRSLPQITDPYPNIKQKIWQYSVATALTAQQIARCRQAPTYNAFALGMLSNLGRCLIVTLYFKLFDQVQRSFREHAQQHKLRELHSALIKITPNATDITMLQLRYGDLVTTSIFEHMELKHLPFANEMRALLQHKAPQASELNSARQYSKLRILHKKDLLVDDETETLWSSIDLNESTLNTLNALNIEHLPIDINPD
jgi:hypothetical protein